MTRSKARLLVVDDSASIVSSLCKVLDLSGYHVEPACSGIDALRKLHQTHYDIVICDIEMPELTGLDFLQKISRDFQDEVSVILMTGFLDQEYFINAIRLGAADFIRKPIDTKQLLSSIEHILGKRKIKDEYHEFQQYLQSADFSFSIMPVNFSKSNLFNALSSFLRHNFKIDQQVLNELLLCMDEMVYNAYIHGTLQLDQQERRLDYATLQAVISHKLSDPVTAARRIRLRIVINRNEDCVMIEVDDDGDGFDHHAVMQKVLSEQDLSLVEHGRGITLLCHLAHKVEFENSGRRVRITKHLSNGGTSKPASI
ncbi:MAG: response regulator [Candidatus Cloacimonetes bacterium]|nr:response regulator [Candidatus Cloacimonadota bacterium]